MIEVRVLGPLAVTRDGMAVDIQRGMLRRLLAVLLCHDGRPVSADLIIDALWEGSQPPTARKSIHVYVNRLRNALGEPASVISTPGGYAVNWANVWLDAHEFLDCFDRAHSAHESGDLLMAEHWYGNAQQWWRGPAYVGERASPPVATAAVVLEEKRLLAVEHGAEVSLALGKPGEVAAALSSHLQEHPYRERLHELLMLALYRAGRQAEALGVYRRTREVLAEELGVEPGPSLARLHQRILENDPLLLSSPRASVKLTHDRRYLPRDIPDFTGRVNALSQLDQLCGDNGATEVVVINAITGTGGIGKTALAVRWAHRAVARFPDGQIYLNLRGYDYASRPMAPIEALTHLLRALDVAPEHVPADLDDASALYRSLLADRQVLILLDNASSAEQVRPLLPASPSCLVLVTSRDRLSGLIARDGARLLTLSALPPGESLQLLQAVVGRQRVAAEPLAAGELADLCGHLPLALRVAAANLATRPHRRIAEYVADLRKTDPLEAFGLPEDPGTDIRNVFNQSYLTLTPEAQRVFRLLALVPGGDFTVESVAALTDLELDAAQRVLAGLCDIHLVEHDAPGRFSLHDLIRAYAAECVRQQEPTELSNEALQRLLNFYLAHAAGAVGVLSPQVAQLPDGPPPAAFADSQSAMAWLKQEQSNLVAAIHRAAHSGPRRYAWQIADALRGYFWLNRDMAAWVTAAQTGLDAATADGSQIGQAAMLLSLGQGSRCTGQLSESRRLLSLATERAHHAGWAEGQITAIGGLGTAEAEAGNLEGAIDAINQALSLNRELGRYASAAVNLGNLVVLRLYLGDLRLACEGAAEALELHRQSGHRIGEGLMLLNSGIAHRHLGQLEAAERLLQDALAIHSELQDLTGQAIAHIDLAELYRLCGRVEQAQAHVERAFELTEATGDRHHHTNALLVLGRVLLDVGQSAQARQQFTEAIGLSLETGHPLEQAQALEGLAATHLTFGQLSQASAFAEESLVLARTKSYQLVLVDALTTLGEARLEQADYAAAQKAAVEAVAISARTGYCHKVAKATAILAETDPVVS